MLFKIMFILYITIDSMLPDLCMFHHKEKPRSNQPNCDDTKEKALNIQINCFSHC